MQRLILTFLFVVLLISSTISQTVHITKSGKKYHSAGCIFLKSDIPIDLKDAVNRGYTPCSKCNPPVLTSSNQNNITSNSYSNTTINKKKLDTTSGRCQAITKKGTQCKRKAKPGSIYCWQHGG